MTIGRLCLDPMLVLASSWEEKFGGIVRYVVMVGDTMDDAIPLEQWTSDPKEVKAWTELVEQCIQIRSDAIAEQMLAGRDE